MQRKLKPINPSAFFRIGEGAAILTSIMAPPMILNSIHGSSNNNRLFTTQTQASQSSGNLPSQPSQNGLRRSG